jgi:hypothetical protein
VRVLTHVPKHGGSLVALENSSPACDPRFEPHVATAVAVRSELLAMKDDTSVWKSIKGGQVRVWSSKRPGWRLRGFKLQYRFICNRGESAFDRLWDMLIDMEFYVAAAPGLTSRQLMGTQEFDTPGVYGDFKLSNCGPNDLMLLWEDAPYPWPMKNREALYVQDRSRISADEFIVTTASVEDDALCPHLKGSVRANMQVCGSMRIIGVTLNDTVWQIVSHVVRHGVEAELTRVVFYDPMGSTSAMVRDRPRPRFVRRPTATALRTKAPPFHQYVIHRTHAFMAAI